MLTGINHSHGTGQHGSACVTDYKRRRAAVAVCVSATAKTTRGALGLGDTKEMMRATLEIALLLLAGYMHFTLTDGVSELLHVMLNTV